MVGWLFFLMILAAVGAPVGSTGNRPVELSKGVLVTPPSGWASASDVWEVGPNGVSFMRAGVMVAFAADDYAGTGSTLLDEQLTQIGREFDSLRALPAAEITVAGGLPAVRALFFGVGPSGQVEGELVVLSHGGTGVVMLAVAPRGQLRQVQADLDQMLETLVLPR